MILGRSTTNISHEELGRSFSGFEDFWRHVSVIPPSLRWNLPIHLGQERHQNALRRGTRCSLPPLIPVSYTFEHLLPPSEVSARDGSFFGESDYEPRADALDGLHPRIVGGYDEEGFSRYELVESAGWGEGGGGETRRNEVEESQGRASPARRRLHQRQREEY